MNQLLLTRSQVERMITQARAEAPLEACGLLGGKNGRVLRVYPATNALYSATRYVVQPDDLLVALEDIAAQGWGPEPLAIYHSHPHGPEMPSETDVAESSYPRSVYIIIAHLDRQRPAVHGFHIVQGQVSEVELKIVQD